MTQKADHLRVKRTKILLREALIALIEERGFNTLTVGALTERAMVSRDEGVPFGAGIQEKDPDLTVLPAPGGPAVLPGHPCRLLAFLDKTGFIHDQDPACLPQMLDHIGPQVITHCLLIPLRLCEQSLDAMCVRVSQFLS